MKTMRRWAAQLRHRFARWLIGETLDRMHGWTERCMKATNAAGERVRQLNALSAVDLPVARDAGFIVVVTKVQGQPRVHLSYIQPELTIAEWRVWQKKLEYDFGAKAEFIDAPRYMRQLAHDVLER